LGPSGWNREQLDLAAAYDELAHAAAVHRQAGGIAMRVDGEQRLQRSDARRLDVDPAGSTGSEDSDSTDVTGESYETRSRTARSVSRIPGRYGAGALAGQLAPRIRAAMCFCVGCEPHRWPCPRRCPRLIFRQL
jgi:hypothetical protein